METNESSSPINLVLAYSNDIEIEKLTISTENGIRTATLHMTTTSQPCCIAQTCSHLNQGTDEPNQNEETTLTNTQTQRYSISNYNAIQIPNSNESYLSPSSSGDDTETENSFMNNFQRDILRSIAITLFIPIILVLSSKTDTTIIVRYCGFALGVSCVIAVLIYLSICLMYDELTRNPMKKTLGTSLAGFSGTVIGLHLGISIPMVLSIVHGEAHFKISNADVGLFGIQTYGFSYILVSGKADFTKGAMWACVLVFAYRLFELLFAIWLFYVLPMVTIVIGIPESTGESAQPSLKRTLNKRFRRCKKSIYSLSIKNLTPDEKLFFGMAVTLSISSILLLMLRQNIVVNVSSLILVGIYLAWSSGEGGQGKICYCTDHVCTNAV